MSHAGASDHRERPATVHDVARVAGVSAQTVSRLIKGYPGIRPSTRERVEAAIDELRYRPNTVARLLRTQKSTRIGAVVHQMFEFGPGSLLRGAAIGAREAGYSLNIVGVDGDDERSIGAAFETFEEERVAGILAITLTDSVRGVVERRLPDVPILVDPAEAQGDGPSMNDSGPVLIAEHLLSLGHRRFGFVAGPDSWLAARQRRDRFADVVTDAGGSVQTIADGDWSSASGDRAARFFDPASGQTAVFAANDAMALGFIHGLVKRGLSVPRDVSVAGFDDIPEAAFMNPSLTTVRPDYEDQGRAAMDALLADIEGKPRSPVRHPRADLIARDSTAPAP
jgi:DNA-binding LacI/PurR family transcriptional regulator